MALEDIPMIAGSNRVKPLSTTLLAWLGSFSQWFFADPNTKCNAGPVLGINPEGVIAPVGPEIPFDPEDDEFQEESDFEGRAIRQRCITFNGRERCYYYYIPECASGASPVVLDLHAFFFCPSATMVWSGFRELSEEKCFLVMWPTGEMDSGLPTGFPLWGFEKETFDRARAMTVDFAQYLVQYDSGSNVTMDSRRIYATGLSDGCISSLTFAMYHSDLIAAVGCHSGAWLVPPAADYTSTPIMAFHGKKDILIPYNGINLEALLDDELVPISVDDEISEIGGNLFDDAISLNIPSFREAFDGLSIANNCSGEKTTEEYLIPEMDLIDAPGKMTIWTATGCDNDAEIKHVTFDTAGHITIGGLSEITPTPGFAVRTTVDTTLMAWNFMDRFQLDEIPVDFL